MIVGGFGQSLSPGNEQRDFWGSQGADTPGSRNVIGIKDPAVDALIEQDHRRPRPRGADRRTPRARPGAAVELLRDPAMAQPRHPRRLLGQARPPGALAALRPSTVRTGGSTPAGARSDSSMARAQACAADRELSGSRCSPISSAGCCWWCRPCSASWSLNFVIIQAAPGGPVEQMIAEHPGRGVGATARLTGGGGGERGQRRAPAAGAAAATAARAGSTRSSSASSSASTASTSPA